MVTCFLSSFLRDKRRTCLLPLRQNEQTNEAPAELARLRTPGEADGWVPTKVGEPCVCTGRAIERRGHNEAQAERTAVTSTRTAPPPSDGIVTRRLQRVTSFRVNSTPLLHDT